jgi:hypothetical protein
VHACELPGSMQFCTQPTTTSGYTVLQTGTAEVLLRPARLWLAFVDVHLDKQHTWFTCTQGIKCQSSM